MPDVFHSAHSTADSPEAVASELLQGLGEPGEALVLFFSPRHDGAAIARALGQARPGTKVIGCSTAGEISTGRLTMGGVSAASLGHGLVKRSAVALARCEQGVATGVKDAVAQLEASLGTSLRALDPQRHVGLIFLDSTHAIEEAVHVELGNLAPLLAFVGGSAGDDLVFQRTHVLAGQETTTFGCALMVLEVERPFQVVKLCHYGPMGVHFRVTRADGRKLLELDGRPAAEVYAEHVGVTVPELGFENLAPNPAGLVIEGEAWVRQIVPPFKQDGAILLGCEVVTGSTLHFLRPRADLVSHFREEMGKVRSSLGGTLRGALMFDCGLRRLELETTGTKDAYAQAIDFPAAGFHTHGESYLGHMHQTLTALVFG